jgi:hypothetical protein
MGLAGPPGRNVRSAGVHTHIAEQSVTAWKSKSRSYDRARVLAGVLFACIGATATCTASSRTSAHATTRSLSVPKETEALALCVRIEAALADKQFGSLDATEVEMRNPNVRLLGGNSQLYHFYGALAAYSDSSLFSCHSQFTFDQKRQLLEAWLTANPQSIAAHIAFSQFWSNAGWTQRGDRYSDDVTAQQWEMLASALAKAKLSLIDFDGRADPHMYFVLMEIARGLPDPRPVLDRLYASAIKAYPSYFHYYSQRASALLERWYGRPGELKTYSASLLQSPGSDAGLVAYSYVTFTLMQFNERSTLLQTTGLSWPIIRAAYARREELYGLRNRDWNALCNLALAAIDRDAAKAALAKIEDRWDPDVWKERGYFDAAVSWTLGTQK